MINICLYSIPDSMAPDRWDNNFIYSLKNILNQVIGKEILIHSNISIEGAEFFDLEKFDISKTDICLIVLLDEGLDKIYSNLHQSLIDSINNDTISRFFIIQKYPKQEQFSEPHLNVIKRYPFYELNHRTLQYIRYDSEIEGDSENGFWSRISDLAFDIKYVLEHLDNHPKNNSGLNIYLAEPSKDQLKNFEKIKRELLFAGFNVLPAIPLSRQLDDFEIEVKGILENCFLSVNILGELYGDSPESSDYSYTELQNRVYDRLFSSKQSEEDEVNIQRIIWTPPLLEFLEEKQAQYLKRIKKELLYKTNTEFVQSSITELLKLIDYKYKKSTTDVFEFLGEKESDSSVLIISDSEEFLPEFFLKIGQKHHVGIQMLLTCNNEFPGIKEMMSKFKFIGSFILIDTDSGEPWLNNTINNIIRSKGYPDALPVQSIGVFSNSNISTKSQLIPIEIIKYQLNKDTIKNQLEQHISKSKL